jgi:hypothetical protein
MFIIDKNKEASPVLYIISKFKLNQKSHQIADLEARKFSQKMPDAGRIYLAYAF